MRIRTKWRSALVALAVVGALLVAATSGVRFAARDAVGAEVSGTRLARAERSPQWRDGMFRNRRPRVDGPYGTMISEFYFGGSNFRTPGAPVPTVARARP